jgi:hypothetical protein
MLSGLDIGPPPSYLIPENIKRADAPTRYPFLWNASIQDYTQWPGFSPNGNRLLGLSRNIGEVTGVFSTFHPQKDENSVLKINYVANNSANFEGLNKQEDLIMKLGPPKWPWALNKTLVAAGKLVYNKKDAHGDNKSCADCHGIKPGEVRDFGSPTWATPIMDVGTDSREASLLASKVKTGVLENARIFPNQEPLKAVDKAISVLAVAGTGTILQHYFPQLLSSTEPADDNVLETMVTNFGAAVAAAKEKNLGGFGSLDDLKNSTDLADNRTYTAKYEARVLQGIWAAAPYLHNGSVPTLAELLKPATQRVNQFKVGAAYDINSVGLATLQPKLKSTLVTTGCNQRNSGNSRCGHEYGTHFSANEKRALLEYLKSL